ncbi:unnamed protein product [Pleuronectes platessa]|uniref:Uncharacterized protein n=1 Tax=Pleuronectes platessa TaxID=8262 RepID=A0A9N7TVF6_PLEPL|nr:unnamed protein product [Pleuronectes platessa]
MQKPDIVMSLRIELLRAIKEIKALKYGAVSLKEKVEQLENQLKDRDDVIKKEVEKEKEKEKETEKEKEIQTLKEKVEQLENQLKDRDDVTKKEMEKEKEKEKEKETEKEKEIQTLKEKVEQLENQLKDKDDVITKEVKKRRARLRAYLDCLAELTDCQAKAQIMEASLHQEPPQADTSCSSEVELEKEKEKEIQALNEQVEQLHHQLIDKDGVKKKEVKKRRARLRAYLDSLAELTDCQAKAQIMEVSLHQEPETRRSSEVEVNKEKEKVLASGPKGNETAAGDNSNYGTELQKGGGRDELEERGEVEKHLPHPLLP